MRRTIITVASTLVVVQAVKECKVFLESGGAVSTYFYVKRVQLTRMIMPSSDKQLMGIINGDLTERDVSVATFGQMVGKSKQHLRDIPDVGLIQTLVGAHN
jgi:hypothetical protein